MASPGPSEPVIARSEQSSTAEAQENSLENEFMKVIKVLKEDMWGKKSLKEIKESTKNWKKSLKSQDKTRKQMKEMLQALKMEIEAIKKT